MKEVADLTGQIRDLRSRIWHDMWVSDLAGGWGGPGLISSAVGRMLVSTERKARWVLWQRRKLESARIRVAIVRRQKRENIAATIARVSASSHLSPVAAAMRNAPPARRRVWRDNHQTQKQRRRLLAGGSSSFFSWGNFVTRRRRSVRIEERESGHRRSCSSLRLNFQPREFPLAMRESFSNSAAFAFGSDFPASCSR